MKIKEMGPSKKKGSVRRQVLDLNTREDSPSRPTWQTKYQHVLPTDEIHENGDAHTLPSQKNNPLSGLLGNYNSDSDNEETNQKSNSTLDAKVEDFLKEIHSISAEGSNHPYGTSNIIQPNKHSLEETLYPPSVTAWQQCYDHNSGYPYYWNTETNEVTWEMPADLKAAIANIAAKQQEQQQQQQQVQIPNQQPQLSAEVTKKVCKYPWQTESDSEDEKIEMITSFGPQSGEESEEDDLTNKKYDKSKKVANTVGPQLPIASHTPCMDPSKIRSNCISLAPEDPEGLSEPNYETSSLLAHGVQDTGPPGDDSFLTTSESVSSDKVVTSCTKNDLVVNKLGNETTSVNTSVGTNKNLTVECSSIKPTNIVKDSTEEHCIEKPDVENCSLADDVIAQIEKETPPDYKEDQKVEKPVQLNESEAVLAVPELLKSSSAKSSGIALLANYGDDSESEDNNFSEKHKNSKSVKTPSKSLFPIDIPEEKEKIKTLFPCAETDLPKMSSETRAKDLLQEEPESVNNIYNSEVDVSDPAAHKAFKRKKRLEFATTTYGPSTSKWPELKSSSPEQAVSVSNTLYNMDPFMNEHRGFGFNSLRTQIDSEKKTYKNFGGIQFVKAETINPSGITESKERIENEPENCSAPGNIAREPVLDEEIEDAATLLREKVTFLTGGSNEISPILHMAIELETLVLAWQQGALTPPYLLRWLNEKCADLMHHEKTAAPSGWTCLWDRKNKRYYYRNSTTKAIQWDYPSVEEKVKSKEGDVEGGGDEMDICDTPPHLSPTGPEKQTDQPPSTPPPPVISDVSEDILPSSPMPQPPPPPQISYCPESENAPPKPTKKKKRKVNEVSQSGEGEEESIASTISTISTSFEQTSESVEAVPPLPPMPPPPPPPPDESPPPLPDSPPPLPLDPDQPLPPGVDEPEYSLYRRVSPKHSYKKSQADSSTYSTEIMMTYGYGLPVQQVVPSNGQPMTMQMQPLEYHTYLHESVSNPYLVQSAPTAHVIQCSAKKPKLSLNSELMSFYSDLAMLDASSTENSNSDSQTVSSTPTPTQEPVVTTAPTTTSAPILPVTTAAPVPSAATSLKATDSTTLNGLNVKKKKKAKTTSGLSLKKKGVSSLVAKWQQVQQEVRRDFSGDEDDVMSAK